MDLKQFVDALCETLRDNPSYPTLDIAGVNHEEGDFGLDVALMDGSEFHVEITKTQKAVFE